MSVVIKKETIQRLLHDVKSIIKNPLTDNGIYYIHDDTDMLKGYALLIGSSDTPYYGGYYFFKLVYPTDYPHSPPKVTYCTNSNNIRFNPNLYTCGKVCVSLLNTWSGEQWTSCQTISTVLLTLCTLLCKDPLLNEPGITISHPDIKSYNEIIEYSNLNIAVCDIFRKKSDVYVPFFDLFYSFIKEHLLENIDKFIEICEKKNETFEKKQIVFKTRIYNMNITVDYNTLLEKLQTCKTELTKI
jgi:ubiquitin-protein ligase